MLNMKQRNIIRDHLDAGMTPDAIANYLARLADLEEPDIVTIRSAAHEILNERPRQRRISSAGSGVSSQY